MSKLRSQLNVSAETARISPPRCLTVLIAEPSRPGTVVRNSGTPHLPGYCPGNARVQISTPKEYPGVITRARAKSGA